MAPLRWKDASVASKVEGRVRCHKCRLVCRDAAHYLNHTCGTGVSLTPYGASQYKKHRVNHAASQ